MKAFFAVTLLLAFSKAEEISCPNLICASHVPVGHAIDGDKCYQHDKQQPNEQVLVYNCDWYKFHGYSRYSADTTVICDLSILTDEYAWVNEATQEIGEPGTQNLELIGNS